MDRFHLCLFWIREVLERDLIDRNTGCFWREVLQTIEKCVSHFRKREEEV